MENVIQMPEAMQKFVLCLMDKPVKTVTIRQDVHMRQLQVGDLIIEHEDGQVRTIELAHLPTFIVRQAQMMTSMKFKMLREVNL